MIVGIDPGDTTSGYVVYDNHQEKLVECESECNNTLLRELLGDFSATWDFLDLVIEHTPPYTLTTANGRAFVPNQVVLTAIEIGRFVECWGSEVPLIPRTDVKKHLLGRTNGTDSMVTQALAARFGGTTKAAKGTKKKPGPLYGIKGHAWQALAVVITYLETQGGTNGNRP